MDATWAETALRDLEAAAFTEKDVRDRNADVLEHDFRRSVGHAVVAEYRQRPQDPDARGILGNEHHRLLPVLVRVFWSGFSHEDDHLAAWIGRTGRAPLPPVDHVLLAVAHDRTRDVRPALRTHQ